MNPNNTYDEYYVGDPDDDLDILRRCTIMCDAIHQATRSTKLDKSGTVLKVFLAPEFYFRGSRGVYPIEKISSIIEKMRSYTAQSRFQNWIFVFGTALGELKDGSSKEIFNVALVQRGGTLKSDVENSLVVYKEYISHIDFIRNAGLTWGSVGGRRVLIGDPGDASTLVRPTQGSRDLRAKATKAVGTGRESTKSGLGGQCKFKMCGLTFGLEVCLDHFKGRLRDSPPARGDTYAQVHLIPSAGMSIKDAKVATLHEGLVFNVDAKHTALRKNDGTYSLPATSKIDSVDSIDLSLAKSLHFKGTLSDFFAHGAGNIEIYPIKQVPKAQIRA
jgi:hypothetical protein